MALLMTPFLTLALVLVDAGRYNSSISVLDEAMGVSAVSTLSHSDSYLHERWGILGLDPKVDIQKTYEEYLDINAGIMGESLTAELVDVKGLYDLANNEILYNQILEFSKLNVPTELAMNFLDIADLIGMLERINSFGKIFDLITNGTNVLDASMTVADSAEALKATANNLAAAIDTYHTSYGEFETAVSDLITVLNESEPKKEDYKDQAGNLDSAKYDQAVLNRENKIKKARNDVKLYRDAYATAIGNLAGIMDEYKVAMKDCSAAFGDIATNLAQASGNIAKLNYQQAEDKYKAAKKVVNTMEALPDFDPQSPEYKAAKDNMLNLEREYSEIYTEYKINDAAKQGLEATEAAIQNTFSRYDEATFGQCIAGLRDLKKTVEKFNADDITATSNVLDEAVYHAVKIADYVSADDIDKYLEQQKQDLLGGSLKSILDGLVSTLNALTKISFFYEPELSATIDMSYYNEKLGGLPGDDSYAGSIKSIIDDIGKLLRDTTDFKVKFITLRFKQAGELLQGIFRTLKSLIANILRFIAGIVDNIVQLATNYEHLYCSTYTAFNLPCRTDLSKSIDISGGSSSSSISFTGLTEYSLSGDDLPKQQDIWGTQSKMADLAEAIRKLEEFKNQKGSDLTFSGAELEYILYGSTSEKANQLYTFFALYLLRLVLDASAVTIDVEVQALASLSTLGYPLVITLMVLAEPLIDTILLVNGASIEFVKTSVYLTPSGLPGLIEDFMSFVKLTSAEKKEFTSSILKAHGTSTDEFNGLTAEMKYYLGEDDVKEPPKSGIQAGAGKYANGLMSFDYREYCFFILLLTVKKEHQFARLKNLIQMETLYHYQKDDPEYIFDLRKSYTCLDTEVKASVKQMMPSAVDSSLFTVTRRQYRGY